MHGFLDIFKMNCNPFSTPLETGLKLVKESRGKNVGNTVYKVVGSLMYLQS